MSGEHEQRRVTHYTPGATINAFGYVAWCSCGIGSPLKATKAEAEQSLAKHTADPHGKGRFPS